MKKTNLFLTVVLSTALMASSTTWGATNDLSVKIDGKKVVFADAKPFIQSGSNRTMVPIRFIAENLGCKVDWVSNLKLVSIKKGAKNVQLYIGQPQAWVDGEVQSFDAPPVIKDDRTFVPLRFISEALDADVEWLAESKTVAITTPTDLPEETAIEEEAIEQEAAEEETIAEETSAEEEDVITTEEPATEQPPTEQPATEQPATEQPATEQPATEQMATEEPATEQPATEQPTTKQPASDDLSSIQVVALPDSAELLKDYNTENVLFVEIDGVEEKYQGDAFDVAKCLVPAIRPEDRTFDFKKALEIIDKSSDLAVVETMNQTITQNSEDTSLALDKISTLLKNSIGLVLTDKLKESMKTDLATAFAGGTIYDKGSDEDGALGITWSSESWEKGKTYHYKIVYGIKDKNSGKILYAIPYQLELATSKYSKKSWFGLKEENGFSCSINVEAIKIAKLLNH